MSDANISVRSDFPVGAGLGGSSAAGVASVAALAAARGESMQPRALAELFPDWKAQGAPLNTPVTQDRFLFLTPSGSFGVPDWMLPDCFKNHGNYVASLGNLCRWPISKSALSCAGVTFNTPVPNSKSTCSSPMMGMSFFSRSRWMGRGRITCLPIRGV